MNGEVLVRFRVEVLFSFFLLRLKRIFFIYDFINLYFTFLMIFYNFLVFYAFFTIFMDFLYFC